ncbi:23991_t:CDS:2 [Racocetra persica]|uniref:23991_t:CDS:1 n=1 Tax=Racocetra persica TaxID=160502 RepID=A0ACA9LUZ7_9GLOM|nr:23991_t:CDS:2 [Racocetra persica]
MDKSSNVLVNKIAPSQDNFDNQLDVPKNDKLSNDQFLEAALQIKSNTPISDKNSDLTKQDN